MPEYAEMKNADLQSLLKSRGLSTTGKKADLVERLTKNDEDNKDKAAPEPAESAAPAAQPAAAPVEDEINWSDDEDTAPASTKPAEPAATDADIVAKAGGEGQAANPQAVPNQVAAIDPSQTDDLSVKAPGEGEEQVEEQTEEKVEEEKKPEPVYTKGLEASNIDEELERRRKRAERFGTKIEDSEALKLLEREKKFGKTGPPKGLDEALPERPQKRGRDANDQGGRGRNKRRGDNRAHADRNGGRRGGNRDGDRRRDNNRGSDNSRSNNGSNWMSEADRIRAEERKKKFATA